MILLLLEISLELLEPSTTVRCISKLPCDADGEILKNILHDLSTDCIMSREKYILHSLFSVKNELSQY